MDSRFDELQTGFTFLQLLIAHTKRLLQDDPKLAPSNLSYSFFKIVPAPPWIAKQIHPPSWLQVFYTIYRKCQQASHNYHGAYLEVIHLPSPTILKIVNHLSHDGLFSRAPCTAVAFQDRSMKYGLNPTVSSTGV
jgi:hypothetical protein